MWAIKNSSGDILKENGKIKFFGTADEGMRYIDRKCGGSPYLRIVLWKEKKRKI